MKQVNNSIWYIDEQPSNYRKREKRACTVKDSVRENWVCISSLMTPFSVQKGNSYHNTITTNIDKEQKQSMIKQGVFF